MILETERLVLRPLTLADAAVAFHGWTGDAEVAEYVSWLPHYSIEDTVKWIDEIKWADDISEMDCFIWGFVLKETGELIGSGGLIWEEDWQLYQVGYNIMKTYWGRGFTTEAMRTVLAFAADELGLKKLAGGHAKENIGSRRVLEKLGFVYDRDDITPHVDGTKVFDSREYYLDLSAEGRKKTI
jgi:Acetyltransferases, including N-acetylases of ribosomal proteins